MTAGRSSRFVGESPLGVAAGWNPDFVRRVWERRRRQAAERVVADALASAEAEALAARESVEKTLRMREAAGRRAEADAAARAAEPARAAAKAWADAEARALATRRAALRGNLAMIRAHVVAQAAAPGVATLAPDTIMAAVAAGCGVTVAALAGPGIGRHLTSVRQVAMAAVAVGCPQLTLKQVAALFGRDATAAGGALRGLGLTRCGTRGQAEIEAQADGVVSGLGTAVARTGAPRSVEAIVAEVAGRCGVRADAVLGCNHSAAVAAVRGAAMCAVALERPDLSLPRLGRAFGRHHTTVMHALRTRGVYEAWQRGRRGAGERGWGSS